jgi:peptide deformylase
MEIRKYGDPVLRKKAAPVERVDEETTRTCQTMIEAMLRAKGMGIAAPQIGVSKRIIVLDTDGELHILVNPELVELSLEKEEVQEGCLSVPGVEALVPRHVKASLRGTTLEGEPALIRGEGILARAMQHEIDHLNGVLFVDYLSAARRKSLLKEYSRKLKEKDE